jgi:competence protein ComEA
MGGREARAALLFVLASLIAGAAYRTWVGPEGPTFVERLRALEEDSRLADERGAGARAIAEAAGSDADDSFSSPDAAAGPLASGDRRAAATAGKRSSPPSPLARLDVDRASASDFERLPGIGPALAARIVEDRSARGPFAGPDGLRRVRGIGPKTLDRLRPYLRGEVVDSVSPFAK